GWMAALIPEVYGGSGLRLTEASVIMEEINRSGGNSGACHGQMYNMNTLIRHGSEEQKRFYLPKIASGELRLQSSSTTKTSAFVWSIWTTSRGRATSNDPGTGVVAFTVFCSPRRF